MDKYELLKIAKEKLSEELLTFASTLVVVPLEIESYEDSEIVLVLPTVSQKNILVSTYLDSFQACFDEITNKHCNITVLDPSELAAYRESKNLKENILSTSANVNSINIKPEFTFDTFIVGNNNQIAFAAAETVAESQKLALNPLFIYGGPGLGKTHLMHAIANKVIENHPNKKIIYITSENFLNDLVFSIKSKNADTEEFRKRYRNADILLIDDIQFLSGKETAQQELFNTFNDLHSKGKLIILSADKPPKDIPVLEERLKSRFNQGAIVDISKPSFETRLAILNAKAEKQNLIIDPKILSLIADRIDTNIRDLEGALNKVSIIASFTKTPITVEIAEKAINEIAIERENSITPDSILDVIANYFNIQKKDLLSSKKSHEVVFPRQIAMYLCRDKLNLPYKRIGEIFGKKDHTTIMHAESKIKKEILINKKTKLIVESVDNILNDKSY